MMNLKKHLELSRKALSVPPQGNREGLPCSDFIE